MLGQVKPVLLVIRDGWGTAPKDHDVKHNAIFHAQTPCSDQLSAHWPHTYLKASGLDVGLPEGIMGNSEVGHQNIGAGRIVNQELVRLNTALGAGQVENTACLEALKAHLSQTQGRLHLIGLASDGGVHSSLQHLYDLVALFKQHGIKELFLHTFTDGRDTPPHSGLEFINAIEAQFKTLGLGTLASLCGRFWAMDRDQRWDRVQKAYDCLTGHQAQLSATCAQDIFRAHYSSSSKETPVSDEFLPPSWILNDQGQPLAPIQEGDAVVFFNFRGDRPRELSQAFLQKNFEAFPRARTPKTFFATLTDYQAGLCPHVLFPKPAKMQGTLGEVVSDAGRLQFRCAETEKYPHVTFFFNDYRDDPFPGEERVLIPSPRHVSTYDQAPEMSAAAVTQATEAAIRSQRYALIVVNYANPDMVGHTGSLPACIAACQAVDQGLAQLLKALDAVGGSALITADHGNAECLWDPESKSPHTRHTLYPVELVLYAAGLQKRSLRPNGRLADIAPTLLELLQLPQPAAMTGQSLII